MTVVKILNALSNNNFYKNWAERIMTNRSTTDQQSFFTRKSVSLGMGKNKAKFIKVMRKTFLKISFVKNK